MFANRVDYTDTALLNRVAFHGRRGRRVRRRSIWTAGAESLYYSSARRLAGALEW